MDNPEHRKKYIITREPIGTANKILTDQSGLILNLQSEIKQFQAWLQILTDKISGLDGKLDVMDNQTRNLITSVHSVDEKLSLISKKAFTPKKRTTGQDVETQTTAHCRKGENDPTDDTSSGRKPEEDLTSTPCKEVKKGPTVILNTNTKVDKSKDAELWSQAESSQVLTLNSEEDYPYGSWLGQPDNTSLRVRVPLTTDQLMRLEQLHPGPEKMALALLDHLFPREVLAESNLTGKGKHKKRKLNPLLIFGIYAHLKYHYSISEESWSRIKNNLESKCRFLWRRKLKKLPLGEPKPLLDGGTEGEGCNLVVYPLYQVDSRQLIRVVSSDNKDDVRAAGTVIAAGATPPSLQHEQQASSQDKLTSSLRDMNAMQVDAGEEGGKEEQPTNVQYLDSTSQEGTDAAMVQQNLNLSNTGNLILTDLGEVISISEEVDVDCMMVSSVDYL